MKLITILALTVLLGVVVFPAAGQPAQVGGPTGRFRLRTRGLHAAFERRGWESGYRPGEVIQNFKTFDSVVGSTVAAEVARQLDIMRAMGINTISLELRSADKTYIPGPFVPPTCNLGPVLGFQWPQPTPTELTNLVPFFDLLHRKGMRVFLRLVNTHMDQQPPTNSEVWLGSILRVVKDHPALSLVLFEGNTHLVDTNGDGLPDACGVPAEPPLWMGPTSVPAQYVRWAIGYGLSLGIPAHKLSAEAIIGFFRFENQDRAGPDHTDRHLWSPIKVLKMIFDELRIPDNQRTYAVSFYEHRKCFRVREGLPCVDADPHTWAEETLQGVLATVGPENAGRVVAPEMGAEAPVDPAWPTERALESLVVLLEKYGTEGGAFWAWTHDNNADEKNPQLWTAVKRRGVAFVYNPVQKEILDMGGFHLTTIPNGSFETGAATPDYWTITGNGTGLRYPLAEEPGQPEVPSRGTFALRLITGPGGADAISATSETVAVTPNSTYTTTANLRFGWSGDPNPRANPATRPQVFVAIRYVDGSGRPSTVRPQDVFRFFQEHRTQGFGTFPLQYTTPNDARAVRVEVGIARNGLPGGITFDVDNVR